MESHPVRRWPLRVAVLVGYLVMLALLALGLVRARRWANAAYASAAAQANWQEFRDDVAQDADRGGPVRRRVPQSGEPPALVLMRDHFPACAALAVVLSSALYFTLAFFFAGALAPAPPPNDADRSTVGEQG
jgi:hypothetical protein